MKMKSDELTSFRALLFIFFKATSRLAVVQQRDALKSEHDKRERTSGDVLCSNASR